MALDCLPFIKNNHGQIQAALYFASTILAFFVAVPVGIALRHFQGSCFLYAQIVWDNTVIWPWSESSCDFIIYFNVALMMLYALCMGLFTVFVIMPRTRSHYKLVGTLQEHNSRYIFKGLNPAFMVINSIITMLVICAAGTLTGGFIRTCDWTTGAMNNMDYLKQYDSNGNPVESDYSCIEAQGKIRWDQMKIVRGTSLGVNGGSFFNCYVIATIASWLLAIVWATQLTFNVLAGCEICTCEVAEEKRKPDKSFLIAQRRSRMATPIGTPGGQNAPVPLGQPMPQPQQQPPPQRGLPPGMGPGPMGYDGPGHQSYGGRSAMSSQSSYRPPPPQEKMDPRDFRDPRDLRDPRDGRDPRFDLRDVREGRDVRDAPPPQMQRPPLAPPAQRPLVALSPLQPKTKTPTQSFA